MILAALEIENYKQYAGAHRIDFPAQGMIAITGPNGAGKTTLFEAIEWCLYAPRTIPRPSIPPHGGVGITVVRVVLEDTQDGRRYIVERELRLSGAKAEIYCEDAPAQPVVQGPKDVTEYVTKTLIGLPHGAFVSTFFTRQKELTFFGDLMPTARRVEVARLLGFQTIREAQEELAAERTEVRHSADSMRSAFVRESAGRDFPAEIAVAQAEVAQARTGEAEAATRAEACEREVDSAHAALEHWRALQEQDATFEREELRIAGEASRLEQSRIGAEEELRRLAQRAEERAALLPLVAQVDAIAAQVFDLDRQRELAEKARGLEETRSANTQRIELVSSRIGRLVEEHTQDAGGVIEWAWTAADAARPEDGGMRLSHLVSSLSPRTYLDQVERLKRVGECARAVDAANVELGKLQKHFERLTAERNALLRGEDPQSAIAAAESHERQARDAERTARQTLIEARTARGGVEKTLQDLRQRRDAATCPTCAQPLSAEAAAEIEGRLEADQQQLTQRESAANLQIVEAQQRFEAARQAQAAAIEKLGKIAVFDGRLQDGETRIEAAQKALASLEIALTLACQDANVQSAPSEDEITVARGLAERVSRLASLARRFEDLAHQAEEARAAIVSAETSLASIGPVAYDAEAHREAHTRLTAAQAARAGAEQIDKELADRPRYEAARASAEASAASLDVERQRVTAERTSLGFDSGKLAAAREADAAARSAAQSARSALHDARLNLHGAESRLERVMEARDRLRALDEESLRLGREADELDRMVAEFVHFDRYVADRVGPLLAETTERLLSQVTDGKYDHVRFDENYGIDVFDGDEAFALTGFSGGERDVVSLCARLAMSELVGSSAVRPPRFLVLDEVFGSLDGERRAQLLGTLGSLASDGRFQQVFIISHVDDVQQSHVMDEAWTVEERDGVSHVVRPMLALDAIDE